MSLESLMQGLQASTARTKARRTTGLEALKAAAATMVPPTAGGGGGGSMGGSSGGGQDFSTNRRIGKGGWPAKGQRHQHGGYSWASWAGDINVPGSGDYGNPVTSWKRGKVVSVKRLKSSYGNHIRVRHPDGSETLYAHLSGIGVRPGQRVRGGQVIGRVGSTGNSSGPHLHFEIKR
jgi:murein DD-endopeptidase MepM/ murein hydrolase activator NlpD